MSSVALEKPVSADAQPATRQEKSAHAPAAPFVAVVQSPDDFTEHVAPSEAQAPARPFGAGVPSPGGFPGHVRPGGALAAAALEPNVFFEPWMLLPAWRAFGQGVDLRVVLVYGPDPIRPQGPAILYGMFPL